MPPLTTARLFIRPPRDDDAAALTRALHAPEVARWWPGFDEGRVRAEMIAPDPDTTVLVIETTGVVAGAIQFSENADPQYRHAGIDLFLDPAWHGQGLGAEAIRAVVEHLFGSRGHHRVVIDPALANARAIRAYEKVGFRRVGVLRQYERDGTGRFRDGLLMELLASDYQARRPRVSPAPQALTVRRAGEADVPALLEMMEDFNRLEEIAWTRERGEGPLRHLLRHQELGLAGLLCTGADVWGYFVVTWGYDLEWDGRDAFLTELYLRAGARGRGLGRPALAAAEALAREHGARALHLMVRLENEPALRLYQGAGYISPPRQFLSKRL